MRVKKLTALLTGGAMAASVLTGCGGLNKDADAAVFDETKVSLGLANFAVRLYQAGYDDYYRSIFGEEVWISDLFGGGMTMEQEAKQSTLDGLKTMYILRAHMDEYSVAVTEEDNEAIREAAAAFIADNGQDALNALGAEQEIVEEYLTLQTIQSRMQDAIMAETDTSVSDEEAATGTYSYVTVSRKTYTDEEGNSAEYTEEEQAALKETMEKVAEEAKADSLENAAAKQEYTVSSGTFTAEDESLDEAVLAALKGLGEGEVSGVTETEENYYILRLDAEKDADATEETRKSIIEERRSEHYDEVVTGWEEGHTWTVNEKNWEKVEFDNLFTTTVESTETEPVEGMTEEQAD